MTAARYAAFRNPATSTWVVLDRQTGRAVQDGTTHYKTKRDAAAASAVKNRTN